MVFVWRHPWVGALILILFCLILYRTCRHYKARKASSAAKRPASSPSGVSTPSLSRKPSHKRCPRPPTIHRPHLNGIQKQKVKMVNGGILSYATDSPPMARSEAEHRMAMRAAGATGITPPPKPAPPGFKRIENQPTDAPHTSTSKLIVISKLIVKCKISFYLLTLKPTYYYCIAHFSFQYYTL